MNSDMQIHKLNQFCQEVIWINITIQSKIINGGIFRTGLDIYEHVCETCGAERSKLQP